MSFEKLDNQGSHYQLLESTFPAPFYIPGNSGFAITDSRAPGSVRLPAIAVISSSQARPPMRSLQAATADCTQHALQLSA